MGRNIDRQTSISDRVYGEIRECELCKQEGLCNLRDGLVACQGCQAELLPSGWRY
jgi:hypothetical protein